MDNFLNTLGKVFSFVVILFLTAFISSCFAVGGARLGGEPFSDPATILPPTLGCAILGFVVGAVLFCIAYGVVMVWKKDHAAALGLSLVSALVLVLVVFCIGTVGTRRYRQRQDRQQQTLLEDLKQHPEHLGQLMQKAKTTPLSNFERNVFMRLLYMDNFLTEAQLDSVIDFLESNAWSVNGRSDGVDGLPICILFQHQPVTIRHVYRLYEIHGDKQGHLSGKDSEILLWLLNSEKTPKDLHQKIEQRLRQDSQTSPSSP